MKNLAWRINQGKTILSEYKGTPPLAVYLKEYFKKNKKFGRRDRAEIAQVLFSYFRLGKITERLPTESALALGFYLVNECDENDLSTINGLIGSEELKKEDSLRERFKNVESIIKEPIHSILPDFELSSNIQYKDWALDFLLQPETFIRIVRDKKAVLQELDRLEIPYRSLEDLSVAVPANTKLDALNSAEKGFFYIQDYSSQRVANYMDAEPNSLWWDACAGGGGKSLLFLSKNAGVRLRASDIRKTSLSNYRKRLQLHGFHTVPTEVIDLSKPLPAPAELLDGIILDVPCSGSGTWARSPERARYFDKVLLQQFAHTQKQILNNALSWLKPGGVLLYITCSVFKEENEDQVDLLCSEREFVLEHQEMLTGFEYNADHLFVARLTSPND